MENSIDQFKAEKLTKLSSHIQLSTASITEIASKGFVSFLQSREYFSVDESFGRCEKCKSFLQMIDLPNGLPKIICSKCSDLAQRF